jgi:glyoxylase-like metal-dependent hydrolase (beta-lactamase superfamily II)/rhodanese-related sulfurtransferase
VTTDAGPAIPGIEVGDLLSWVDAGEPVLLLDVRNDEEFETWRFEGRRPLDTVHIPYFNFIEDAEGCAGRLPRGREVVVLCAQGGSSALVVDMLRDAGIAARNVAGGMVAYGEYLEPVKVPIDADEAANWEIWQVNRRGKGCLSYVVRSGRDAIVVDPSRDVLWYESFVRRLRAAIVRVLDTHVHADHLSGGPALAARSGAPYFVSAGKGFELRQPVEPLADGQELRLGDEAGVTLQVRIMATPGHTPGSTSYLVGRRHLLTGDTMFVKSVGRPDLGGHVVEWGQALFHTLHERLATLPEDTVVLPAHFAGADEIGPDGVVAGRLGLLRRAVPELQIATEEAFVAAMRIALKPPPAAYAEIVRANLGLATVDPDKATEWELGKNQCAANPMPAVS